MGGGKGGGGGSRGLEEEERRLLATQERLGGESGAREAELFARLTGLATESRPFINAFREQAGRGSDFLEAEALGLSGEGFRRRGIEEAILGQQLGIPGLIGQAGSDFQRRAFGGASGLANVAQQFTQPGTFAPGASQPSITLAQQPTVDIPAAQPPPGFGPRGERPALPGLEPPRDPLPTPTGPAPPPPPAPPPAPSPVSGPPGSGIEPEGEQRITRDGATLVGGFGPSVAFAQRDPGQTQLVGGGPLSTTSISRDPTGQVVQAPSGPGATVQPPPGAGFQGPPAQGRIGLLSDAATQQFGDATFLGRGEELAAQARGVGGLAGQAGQELGGIRGEALGQLGQALQGDVSEQVSNLFRTPGEARQRDILESQFQNARQRLVESGQRGGALDANLAALEAQRALGISDIEGQRVAQERQLAQNLFQTGVGQGLSALEQQAGLRGAAGGLFGASGQQNIAAEQARQQALGLGGGLAGQFEQLRQQGLEGQLRGLDLALQRELQGIAGGQAALAQQLGAAQGLAGQFGAGADQFRLSAPNVLGQALGLEQGIASAGGIEAGLLQGINVTPASSFLGPATQGVQQRIAAQDAARAQSQAGKGSLFGTLGGAALGAFF